MCWIDDRAVRVILNVTLPPPHPLPLKVLGCQTKIPLLYALGSLGHVFWFPFSASPCSLGFKAHSAWLGAGYDMTHATTILQIFLTSPKPVVRFGAIRTLNALGVPAGEGGKGSGGGAEGRGGGRFRIRCLKHGGLRYSIQKGRKEGGLGHAVLSELEQTRFTSERELDEVLLLHWTGFAAGAVFLPLSTL